jgi:large subunit ribosomal protein L21
VEPNQLLDVERLPAEVGAVVELSDVLLVADGDEVTVGQPRVVGARVVAEVVEHGRGPKIIVFKYKPKTRYRKKTGHRQAYTRLAIRQILTGAEPVVAAAPAKARRRRAPAKPPVEAEAAPPEAAEVPVAEAVAEEEAPPEAAVEAPTAAVPAKARRRRAPAKPPVEAEAAEVPVAEAVAEEAAPAAAAPEEAPKTRRRKAAPAEAAEEAPPKPARRTKRGE